MDSTSTTDQGFKDIISPGTARVYDQRLVWDLDTQNLQQIRVRADYTFSS